MNNLDLFSAQPLIPRAADAPALIRFGKKYRGQPYSVLLADASYALWLLHSAYAQIERQDPALLAFLVGRFGVPARTPDHNLLQNRFLRRDFALRFAWAAVPSLHTTFEAINTYSLTKAWARVVERRLRAAQAEATKHARDRDLEESLGLTVTDPVARELDHLIQACHTLEFDPGFGEYVDGAWRNAMYLSHLEMEHEGADVKFVLRWRGRFMLGPEPQTYNHDVEKRLMGEVYSHEDPLEFRIEIKPVVGDDYPAILRAMKAARNRYLLVDAYTGAGATWDEVVEVFALSGITAVRLADVERAEYPPAWNILPLPLLTVQEARAILVERSTAVIEENT